MWSDSLAIYVPVALWAGALGESPQLLLKIGSQHCRAGTFVAGRVIALGFGGHRIFETTGGPQLAANLNSALYVLSVTCNFVCTVMVGYRAW